jgi:ElaB/YqjD/DUF883 family membrane-anchored ribosome-binding protein
MNRDDQGDLTDIDRDEGAATGNEDNTAEIRANIDQTRTEMSETIDAIQERLSPQHLKEQVKEQVREQFHEAKATVREATIGKAEEMVRNAGDTINEARYSLMETIRDNPIPAAMVGIGLGWLFMNRRSAPSRGSMRYRDEIRYRGARPYYTDEYGYASDSMYPSGQHRSGGGMVEQGQRAVGETFQRAQETAGEVVNRAQQRVGDVTDKAQETVGNVVSQAQETAGNVVSQAQETAGYIADQAQYQAQRVEERFKQTLYENPLAVGAVALALGTAVGFTLPQTERENELLGEARDNLIDRAQEVAQDTVEKVKQVAGDVLDQAQTTVQESVKE